MKEKRTGQEEALAPYREPLSLIGTRYLRVPEDAFRSGRLKAVETGAALLAKRRTPVGFLEWPGFCLFALAVGDAYSSADGREKQALESVLYLAAGSEMRKESSRRGGQEEEWRSQRNEDFQSWSKMEDEGGTQEAQRIMGPSLRRIRKEMGLSKGAERPFGVLVLKKDTAWLTRETGANAWCVPSGEERFLVLGLDWEKAVGMRVLEHEYAHSQSNGLLTGLYELLFRAFNEAVTESLVSEPTAYAEQRLIFSLLLKYSPDYRQSAIRAYMGREKGAVKDFFSKLIGDFGLDGFLSLARLLPGTRESVERRFNRRAAMALLDTGVVFNVLGDRLLKR